jgi:hypothetical protein
MMKRLARIAAVVVGLTFVLISVALIVSYVSPRTIVLGSRCFCLNHGKFHTGTYPRFDTALAYGDLPNFFILLPDAADKPIWPIALVTGASLAVLIHLGRRRVPPPGHCSRCGYNLTGNLSGVCPECATPVPASNTAAD